MSSTEKFVILTELTNHMYRVTRFSDLEDARAHCRAAFADTVYRETKSRTADDRHVITLEEVP